MTDINDHETLMAIKASFGCDFINQSKEPHLSKQLYSTGIKDINDYLQLIEAKLHNDFNYVLSLYIMPDLRRAVLVILDHITTTIRQEGLETTPPDDGLCRKCGLQATHFYEVDSVKMCVDCLYTITDVWNKVQIMPDAAEYEKQSRLSQCRRTV